MCSRSKTRARPYETSGQGVCVCASGSVSAPPRRKQINLYDWTTERRDDLTTRRPGDAHASWRAISLHARPSLSALHHIIIPYRTSMHPTSPYGNVLHRTILYYTVPYLTTPFHTILHRSISYYPVPYHTTSYHTVPYHTTPYQYVQHHNIPFYTVPHVLHHTIPYSVP